MEEDNYKIYLNKANESWVTDRFRAEWYKFNGNTTKYIKNANIIWIIAPWTWKKLNKNKLRKTKTICTIHHIDETKIDEKFKKEFQDRDKFIDIYHVPSKKSQIQIEAFTSKPIYQIPFWVDEKKFFQIEDKVNIRTKYGFKENDYIVGSFQRDTEGFDLTSPKLSKGPDQFIENIKKIKLQNPDKVLKVLIAGYRRDYIIKELKKIKVDYVYHEKPNLKKLNQLYNCLDLYVVASRIEGGPMAILECAIAKVPIISTDVGIASQILHESSIYEIETFETAKPNISFAYNEALKYTTSSGMKEFNNMFKNLYES